MKRCGLNILLLLIYTLLMVACNQEAYDQNETETSAGKASLIINIKSSEPELTSRGIEDLNDDGTVSEQELFVDGRKMYRLAVYLVEAGNLVVATTILEADDPRFTNGNTEAQVKFINLEYHKSYQIYAIANYNDYNNITASVSGIDINNITQSHKVNAGSDNLCNSATPYPLTLKKEILMEPGLNYISGELSRTYARIRISVSNQSSLKDMYITKLSFPNKFIQNSADLFTAGGTANATPTVTSGNAIVPFQNNLLIPMIDDSGNVTSSTIFDSYILESNNGEYKYTLGLKYGGESKEVYKVSSTAVSKRENIVDGAMYVIYNNNSGRYLCATSSDVQTGTSYLTNGELDHDYVWKFTKSSSGNNRWVIESMGSSGYYMQSSNVSTSKVPMTVNPGTNDYFTASNSGSNLRLQSTKSSYYLSVNSSTVCGHSSSSNQNRRNFTLYEVVKDKEDESITHEETIPIHIIDKQTGEAKQLTQIKRNDFINILVNVSYNEKSGNITFEVSDWNEVNGNITFD